MNSPTTPERKACLSSLLLDRFAAAECSQEEMTDIQHHLQNCLSCKERSESRKQFFQRFLKKRPIHLLSTEAFDRARKSQLGSRWAYGRGWRIQMMSGVLGLAVLLTVSVWLFTSQSPENSTWRSKGSLSLQIIAKRGDQTFEVFSGDRLFPQDMLRFMLLAKVDSKEPLFVAILSIDGQQQVSVYSPVNQAMAIEAMPSRTKAIALPDAIELDEVLGRETLLGVFCKRSFKVDALRLLFVEQAKLQNQEEWVNTMEKKLSCAITTFSFEKVAHSEPATKKNGKINKPEANSPQLP